MPDERKPLSNTEVIKLIKTHYARKATEEIAGGMGMGLGSETGNELRKQTTDYIELFNEFELDEQIRDIRV